MSPAGDATRGVVKQRPVDRPSGQTTGRRRALLIGIAEYQASDAFRSLKYPTNDVSELAAVLLGYGYSSVECLSDKVGDQWMKPNRANIQRALERLCSESHPDDLIWVHFSCHGMRQSTEDGRTARLLIAQDTQASNIVETALDLDRELIPLLNDCPARQKVLSLDACHLGYGKAAAIAEEAHPREYQLAEGLAVLAASKAQEYASESKDAKMGIFTASLIKVLRAEVERSHVAELDKVARAVLVEVETWYKTQNMLPQQPNYRFEGLGVLLLVDRLPQRQLLDAKKVSRRLPQPGRRPDFQILDFNGLSERLLYHTATLYKARISKAKDSREPDVIVTVLHEEFCAVPQDLQLYENRLVALRKLTESQDYHDSRGAVAIGIPKIMGQGETSLGRPYFAVEHITGKLLSAGSRGLSAKEVIERGAQLSRTLLAAHNEGVVHGDLRPDGIIKTATQLYVLEFAIAALEVKLRLTQQPEAPRSPYWPPELGPHNPLPTESADVFAIGRILQEMLDAGSPTGAFKPQTAVERELCLLLAKMQAPGCPDMGSVASAFAKLLPAPRPAWQPAAVLCALVAGLVGLYLIVKPPTPPPGYQDMSTRGVDLGHPAPKLDANMLALEVVKAAIGYYQSSGLSSPSQQRLAKFTIQEVGWLHEDLFGDTLSDVLEDRQAQADIREQAARTLGRTGHTQAVPVLETVLTSPGVSEPLWEASLSAMALLSWDKLRQLGLPYLTQPIPPERQLAAAVLLSAREQAAQKFLLQQRQQLSSAKPDANILSRELEVLLGLSWALDTSARKQLADKLASSGQSTPAVLENALKLVESGDRTAIPMLRDSALGNAAPESTDLERNTARMLSHVAPSEEYCARYVTRLQSPPESNVVLFADALAGIPSCSKPWQYQAQLVALLPKEIVDFRAGAGLERQSIQMLAAMALLRISLVKEAFEKAALEKITGRDALYLSRAQLTSQEQAQWQSWLLTQIESYSRLAFDPSRPADEQREGARGLRSIADAQQTAPPPKPGAALSPAPLLPAVQASLQQADQRAQSLCSADHNAAERSVCALVSSNLTGLGEQFDREPETTVQLDIAERVASSKTEKFLLKMAAGQDLQAMRAYAKLRERNVVGVPPPPNVDLLKLYLGSSPAKRVELVEALRAWPRDQALPVLTLATHDGYLEVRRNTARVLGEFALKEAPDKQSKVLGTVRLMYQDNDSMVQKRIRIILARSGISASEAAPAPQWPPVENHSPERPQTCHLTLQADEARVEATLDKKPKPLRLPVTQALATGVHKLSYLNDQGETVDKSLQCDADQQLAVSLPVSLAGQLLGRALVDIKEQQERAAIEKLQKVQVAKPPASRASDKNVDARWQDVLARSSYYLGLAYYEGDPEQSHRELQKFLNDPRAENYPALKREAMEKRQILERKVLGKFTTKQLINGRCTAISLWVDPSRDTITYFNFSVSGVRIVAGTTKTYPDGCK